MWNGRSCSAWQLYVIVDRSAIGARDPAHVALAAARGGADAIQLRDKSGTARWLLTLATRLLPQLRALHVPLIINDRADIAHLVGADGVHLGQDDLPVPEVREWLGPHRLIGQSTHSVEQAVAAASQPLDYLALGPIFPTPTKPDYGSIGLQQIRPVIERVSRPVVCIGGMETSNLAAVRSAGARCIAVVRAVCGATHPEEAARQLKQAFAGHMSVPITV